MSDADDAVVDAVDAVANRSYVAQMRALVDSSEDEDDDATEEQRDGEGTPNKTETAFLLNSNSIKLLCAMCIGINDDKGVALFDVNDNKYSKKKKDIKPSKSDLSAEVERRIEALALEKGPRAKNWSNTQLVNWLTAHPITGEHDVAFLKRAVAAFTRKIVRDQEEAQELHQQQQTQEASGNWRGKLPHLRLILCLLEDDIRMAYLHRADAMTRAQLDARNSDTRPPTVWERIAAKWNDPTFNPTTQVLAVHSDFASTIHCTHASVATLTPATAMKAENLLTAWRATLLRIIGDWEQSGQGDGGHFAEDDTSKPPARVPGDVDFGFLHDRPAAALGTRANFLNGKRNSLVRRPTYLLYFWEVADEKQILCSTFQNLSNNTAASDGNSAPSSVDGSRHRGRNDESAAMLTLASSIEGLAQTQVAWDAGEDRRSCQARIASLNQQRRGAKRARAAISSMDDPMAAALEDEIKDIDEEIEGIMIQLGTPIRNNRTPPSAMLPGH
jgi:hypothetical protein